MCSTRGESWGMYITFASAKIANKAEPTLALTSGPCMTRQILPRSRMCNLYTFLNILCLVIGSDGGMGVSRVPVPVAG